VNEAEMRLTEWGAIENRLEQDYAKRLRQLEKRSGTSGRRCAGSTRPVKQLRQEAAALSEVAVSAANLALQGFERAERGSTRSKPTCNQLSRLSETVQTALADHRRALRRRACPRNVTPFPLEGVMRIHDDLRTTSPSTRRKRRARSPSCRASCRTRRRGSPRAWSRSSARSRSSVRKPRHRDARREAGRTGRVAIFRWACDSWRAIVGI
jgi:hypothetical protein